MGSIETFRLVKPQKLTLKITELLASYSFIAIMKKTDYKRLKCCSLRWQNDLFSICRIRRDEIVELDVTASNINWKNRFEKSAKKAGLKLEKKTADLRDSRVKSANKMIEDVQKNWIQQITRW